MTRHRRPLVALALGAASVFALAGCATPASSGAPALGTEWPAPPSGEVIGQGTVMDTAGVVELCLGPVAESYPPQCSGIPVMDWSWDGVDGSESSGDVVWGAYAVQGTYDGETFAVTEPPIMLALYDPMVTPDATNGEAGAVSDAYLLEIQDELPELLGEGYLSSSVDPGRLRVDVVWDDGTWQDAADAVYGKDVVVIYSALRLVDE